MNISPSLPIIFDLANFEKSEHSPGKAIDSIESSNSIGLNVTGAMDKSQLETGSQLLSGKDVGLDVWKYSIGKHITYTDFQNGNDSYLQHLDEDLRNMDLDQLKAERDDHYIISSQDMSGLESHGAVATMYLNYNAIDDRFFQIALAMKNKLLIKSFEAKSALGNVANHMADFEAFLNEKGIDPGSFKIIQKNKELMVMGEGENPITKDQKSYVQSLINNRDVASGASKLIDAIADYKVASQEQLDFWYRYLAEDQLGKKNLTGTYDFEAALEGYDYTKRIDEMFKGGKTYYGATTWSYFNNKLNIDTHA